MAVWSDRRHSAAMGVTAVSAAAGSRLPGANQERASVLRAQIARVLRTCVGDAEDLLTLNALGLAASAFYDSSDDPGRALDSICPRIRRIGARLARHGLSEHQLGRVFVELRRVMLNELDHRLMNLGMHDDGPRLRHHLINYVCILARQARAGHQTLHSALTCSPTEQRALVRATLLKRDDLGESIEVVTALGLDVSITWTAVVLVRGRLSKAFHEALGTIPGVSAREALVPSGRSEIEIQSRTQAQLVIGPAQPWNQVREGLALARIGAALLAERTVQDDRALVPCRDLAVHLMTASNPLLAQLMVDKHIGQLALLPHARRLRIAEFTLRWLERGQPIATVAREMGIPPQTAHDWMRAARVAFSAALDDPDARLELLIALRTALPLWRAEVA